MAVRSFESAAILYLDDSFAPFSYFQYSYYIAILFYHRHHHRHHYHPLSSAVELSFNSFHSSVTTHVCFDFLRGLSGRKIDLCDCLTILDVSQHDTKHASQLSIKRVGWMIVSEQCIGPSGVQSRAYTDNTAVRRKSDFPHVFTSFLRLVPAYISVKMSSCILHGGKLAIVQSVAWIWAQIIDSRHTARSVLMSLS